MKITHDDEGFVLEEVYNGVLFRTKEGEELGVSMRDGAFEISVLDTSVKSNEKYRRWYVVSAGECREMVQAGKSEPTETAQIKALEE